MIRIVETDGWYRVHAKGGHRQFKHDTKRGRVTISGKGSDTLHPKTAASILSQAQITP